MDDSILLREQQGAVVRLVLNRPEQYNAISSEMLSALQGALDGIGADSEVRVPEWKPRTNSMTPSTSIAS